MHETFENSQSDPPFHVDRTLEKKTRLACTRGSNMSFKNLRHYEAECMVSQKVIWRLSKSDSFFDAKMDFEKKCFVLYVFYEGRFF